MNVYSTHGFVFAGRVKIESKEELINERNNQLEQEKLYFSGKTFEEVKNKIKNYEKTIKKMERQKASLEEIKEQKDLLNLNKRLLKKKITRNPKTPKTFSFKV